MNIEQIQRVARKHLATITFHKDIISIATPTGGVKVPSQIYGSWAVHKTPHKSGRWTVTFIPAGLAIRSDFSSQDAALGFITSLLDEAPGLIHAVDVEAIKAQKTRIMQLLKNVPLAPGAKRGPLVLKTVLDIEGILANEGLSNLGDRYGKAGEFWGLEGMGRVIAVGRRDVMLNVFHVGIGREDQVKRPDTRWIMHRTELKSAITEETLIKWADWVKKGMTTVELRELARTEYLAGTPDPSRYGDRPYVVVTGARKKGS